MAIRTFGDVSTCLKFPESPLHHLCTYCSGYSIVYPSTYPSARCKSSREAAVEETSKLLDVSRDTIMRRIRKGELEAHQEPRPQGHVWRMIIPDEEPDNQHVEALTRELQTVRDVMELL